MRIGTMITYSGGFAETVEEAADLERAGLDIIFMAEAYSFDAVSQLGYLAAKTKTVQLASGIFQIYTRTPSLMAMTAAGLDYVSGGRFVLGIGASGPQVIEGFHGVPYDSPLGRTRELVDICRQVWRREPVRHDGKHYQIPLPPEKGTGLGKPLKLINHPVRERIPIVIAALGPKNVALTAEIAEGWQPIFYHPNGHTMCGASRWRRVRRVAIRLSVISRSTPDRRSQSETTSITCSTSSNRTWRCTSAEWVREARTSTTTSPAGTDTKRKPRPSRICTWTGRRRKLPRPCPTTWCARSR